MLAIEADTQVPGQPAPGEIGDIAVKAGHRPIDLESLGVDLER